MQPGTLDHVQSAAVPLAGLSAWQDLFDHGQLRQGERPPVHGTWLRILDRPDFRG